MVFESGNAPHKKKRVLVVCGEPRALAEIKMALMESFEISIAASGGAALAALNTYGADAIVIYIYKDRSRAFSAFADISTQAGGRRVPVMFLAESDSEGDEAAAFRIGADDYAVKRNIVKSALISRINLRIRAGENERRLAAGGAEPAGAAAEAELAGKTILIAEDIALNQQFIAAILSGVDGLTTEFVSNGAEAVEKFRSAPELYSMILMDVYMPEMDGLSAARAIRGIGSEAARKIPIIALTASAEEEEIRGFLVAGMNGYLEKPMDYKKFLSISAEYCKPDKPASVQISSVEASPVQASFL